MDIKSRRLDHLGIVKGIIDKLEIINTIDTEIGVDVRSGVSVGTTVAAMVLNGLGFISKPLTLTPEYFASKPISHLFGKNITAEMFNASKLSRVLDKLYKYGLEDLFKLLSSNAVSKCNVNTEYNSLDTTSFSLEGNYESEDLHGIKVTHGYSKDKRPDLKQIVLELLVSQDNGIPLMMKTLNGNASDNKVFQERASELVKNLESGDWNNRCLIADSKLYHKNNAINLSLLNFITRIPNSIKESKCIISSAINNNSWDIAITLQDANFGLSMI